MGLPILLQATLGATLGIRVLISVVALAPAGLLMGMPFPQGLARVERMSTNSALIAWAWGVNGAVSVVASILAALLALSLGFSVVLATGAVCYVGALALVWVIRSPPRPDGSLRLDR